MTVKAQSVPAKAQSVPERFHSLLVSAHVSDGFFEVTEMGCWHRFGSLKFNSRGPKLARIKPLWH